VIYRLSTKSTKGTKKNPVAEISCFSWTILLADSLLEITLKSLKQTAQEVFWVYSGIFPADFRAYSVTLQATAPVL
jgi:hypothetical protein